jgi:hypothetical protein
MAALVTRSTLRPEPEPVRVVVATLLVVLA